MSQAPQAASRGRPAVSVVVPFLGSDADLAELVGRLERLDTRVGDELVVADNRSTGAGGAASRGNVIIHPAGGVRSPGFARNRGAARASGAWLVFIDADTEPDAGLLDAYFDTAPDERTAILAGGIVDVASAVAGTAPGLTARHAVRRGHMDARTTLDRPRFAYAQTANCAVRRDAFAEVGGFVEEVPAGEDADLCFRLAERGWKLERRPEAVVRHQARPTLAAALRQLARHGAGAAWCNRRHPGSFPAPPAAQMIRRCGRSVAAVLGASLGRDREEAAFAALDVLEMLAFEGGRLLRNRTRR